jgi:uncharacterized integral membrane protein
MTVKDVRRYNSPFRATPIEPITVRALLLVVKLVLFLLLLGLAVRNSDVVTVRYFLGLEWQAPLVLVIFVAFAIGLVMGLMLCSIRLLRNHRELRSLRKLARQE